MAFDERAAIDRFWDGYQAGEYFPVDWYGRLSLEEAYRVQLGVTDRRVAAGERQVGWKVAQTSEAARRAFGFAEPLFGCLMQDGLQRSGHTYDIDTLIRLRCEPEICVRLCENLSGAIDVSAARRAVDVIYPAFEIIEVRGDIAAQKEVAVADNAAGKGAVLGSPVPLTARMDLASRSCRLVQNGVEVAQGRGAEVLGDPFNAVVWLAAKLAQFGLELKAGDLVMTGSITRVMPLAAGDRLQAEFDGLGAVDFRISG